MKEMNGVFMMMMSILTIIYRGRAIGAAVSTIVIKCITIPSGVYKL
jgi:hypothetical protein